MIAIQDNLPVDCTEGSVPVGEIRTVTTDNQTNHNHNYVNYSTLLLLNTITQKCNFLFSIILLYNNIINTIIQKCNFLLTHKTAHYVPCVQHNMSGVTEPVLLWIAVQLNSFLSDERRQ